MLPKNSDFNHRVAVVVFDRLSLFEFGIACEVFGLPRPDINPWYSFVVCSADSAPVQALGGITINVQRGIRSVESAGTIVIPGWRDIHERPDGRLIRAMQRAARRGARIASLCSGAFVLAAAGLLDGKRATTHWRYAKSLAEEYPKVRVDPHVLYVDEGNILTAAGSAAGIDLCLHLVRRDFGSEVANRVARRLVIPPHREGGQAQFIDKPVLRETSVGIADLLEWLSTNLEQEHSIASMARRAHMSERTFARRFHEQTGTTPVRWLSQERVRHARFLLETTDLGMDRLALACGFGTAQVLRFHFQRLVKTTPTSYRQAFQGNDPTHS